MDAGLCRSPSRLRRCHCRCLDPRHPGRDAHFSPLVGQVATCRHRHREALQRLLHAGPQPGRERRDVRGDLRVHDLRPHCHRRRRRAGQRAPSSSSARRRDQHEPHDDRDQRSRRSPSLSTRQPAAAADRHRHRAAACRRREVIEDDAPGTVETSGVFDPAPTASTSTRAWRGCASRSTTRSSSGRRTASARSGAGRQRRGRRRVARRAAASSSDAPGDFNPSGSRSTTRSCGSPRRSRNVGDHFTGAVVGVIDYNFGNFELLSPRRSRASTTASTREVTTRARARTSSRSARSTSRTSTRATPRRSSRRSPA